VVCIDPDESGDRVLREDDPARRVVDLFSRKWLLLVIYALFAGTRRLSQLQRTIEGISQKMLIQTLRELEEHGFVTRVVHPVVPPHVEYSLTPLGESLREPMNVMCEWGYTHYAPGHTKS
jgi:DNA-binding HxlR family transcriptional regulator